MKFGLVVAGQFLRDGDTAGRARQMLELQIRRYRDELGITHFLARLAAPRG